MDFGGIEAKWRDLECEIRNAVAEERARAKGVDAAKYLRPAAGCSLYWRNRAVAAMQERDVARREALLDRVFWDAAGELVPAASPLGVEALFAYSVRRAIAAKRAKASADEGRAIFNAMADAGKIDLK